MMIKNKFNIWDLVETNSYFFSYEWWIFTKWRITHIDELFDMYWYHIDNNNSQIFLEHELLLSKGNEQEHNFYLNLMGNE